MEKLLWNLHQYFKRKIFFEKIFEGINCNAHYSIDLNYVCQTICK